MARTDPADPSTPRAAQARGFSAFAWGTLAYTLLVAVWGAYVRATGSGAGCGNHWPLCNGEVVPRAPAAETIIELSHRLTSALVGLLVIALVVWAIRRHGIRDRVSGAAIVALVLTIVEGLVGAALVRFDLVAGNVSVARGVVMAIHLVNTLLLLGSLGLVAAWSRRPGGVPTWGPPRLRGQGAAGWILLGGLLLLCILGASGGVTALGDTLYPVAELTDEAIAGLDPTAELLVRLRVLHPYLAVAIGIYLVAAAALVRILRPAPLVPRLALGLAVLFTLELLVGLVNVALAAPVWLQLVHLGTAYLVWLNLVLLAAAALADDAPRERLAGGTAG